MAQMPRLDMPRQARLSWERDVSFLISLVLSTAGVYLAQYTPLAAKHANAATKKTLPPGLSRRSQRAALTLSQQHPPNREPLSPLSSHYLCLA